MLARLGVPNQWMLGPLLVTAALTSQGITLSALPHAVANAGQLLIGIALGFTLRVVFAGIDLAGELIGLQMGHGFAVFYAVCVVVNWWFYLRKNAYIKNP